MSGVGKVAEWSRVGPTGVSREPLYEWTGPSRGGRGVEVWRKGTQSDRPSVGGPGPVLPLSDGDPSLPGPRTSQVKTDPRSPLYRVARETILDLLLPFLRRVSTAPSLTHRWWVEPCCPLGLFYLSVTTTPSPCPVTGFVSCVGPPRCRRGRRRTPQRSDGALPLGPQEDPTFST